MAERAQSDAAPPDESTDRPRILLFFDYACPFCYIDHFRFKDLRREFPVEVMLVPFELRPDMPPDGVSIREYGLTHPPHVEDYLRRNAQAAGVSYEEPDRLPATHDAMVLGEVARDEGEARHWEVHEAIFRAYFGQGRDIGQRAVLLDLAEEHGLERSELALAWDDGAYDSRLEAFSRLALDIGVAATPSALVCGELFVGSRPRRVLASAIRRCLGIEEEAEVPAAPHAETDASQAVDTQHPARR